MLKSALFFYSKYVFSKSKEFFVFIIKINLAYWKIITYLMKT